MTGIDLVHAGQGRRVSRTRALCRQNSRARQWLGQRVPHLMSVVLVLFLAIILNLGAVVPVQAQTPREGFRETLFGPDADTPGVCQRLNTAPQMGGTEDLRLRCNEIAGAIFTPQGNLDEGNTALGQVASEEVATQGTLFVEASNNYIGARLAALRAVIRGTGPRQFALYPTELTPPVTLVASLAQYAAAASPIPAAAPTPFSRLGFFANGTYTSGDKDTIQQVAEDGVADIIEPGFDFDGIGVTAGIEYRINNNFVLGLAFSYQATDADLDADAGSVDINSYSVSIYGIYYVSKFYVDGIVTFGWSDVDLDRTIRYTIAAVDGTTSVSQTARSDTDTKQYSLSFGVGYDFNAGGWTLSPLVRVNYIRLDIDGYQETIDNTNTGFGWALVFDDQEVESLTSVVGGQISYAISTAFGVLLPQVRGEWEHEFKDDRRTLTARFVHDPERAPIQFSTDAPDRDFFNIGVGLSAVFRGGVSAFAYYETVLGLDDVTIHTVTVGVRKEL